MNRDGDLAGKQHRRGHTREQNEVERQRERTVDAVEERTAIGAHIVYEAISAEGEAELKRSTSALAFSGLAAGLSMGFSLFTQAVLKAHLPDTEKCAGRGVAGCGAESWAGGRWNRGRGLNTRSDRRVQPAR